jgi:hypothetical protein
VKAWRIILTVTGIALAGFGLFRLLSQIPPPNLLALITWLVAALIILDAVVSPSLVGVGWLLRRFAPDRGRRYLQLALIMTSMVSAIALPMIYLRGSQPAVKALLLRNYGMNLLAITAGIAVVSLALYLLRVPRDRTRAPVD